jgi:hypothetical protein
MSTHDFEQYAARQDFPAWLAAAKPHSSFAAGERDVIQLQAQAQASGRDDLRFQVLRNSRERDAARRRPLPWC